MALSVNSSVRVLSLQLLYVLRVHLSLHGLEEEVPVACHLIKGFLLSISDNGCCLVLFPFVHCHGLHEVPPKSLGPWVGGGGLFVLSDALAPSSAPSGPI